MAGSMRGGGRRILKLEIAKQSQSVRGHSLDQRIILESLKRHLIEEQKARIRPTSVTSGT